MRNRPELKIVEAPRHDPGFVPPHDLDAEAVLLSDLMSGKPRMAQIREMVLPEDFYSDANREIYEAILAIDDAKVTPDTSLVAGWLRNRERLEHVGGIAYVKKVADASPYVLNIEEHARNVALKGRRRAMIGTAQAIAAKGYYDVGDEAEWLRDSAIKLAQIADSMVVNEAVTVKQSVNDAMRKAHHAIDRGGRITGMTTGFAAVDFLTAGLHRKDMTLLSGRTGRGKTALAITVAANVAASLDEAGQMSNGVGFFSLEMPHDQLGLRMACSQARVDSTRIAHGKTTMDEARKLMTAAQYLSDLPIVIDDTKRITPSNIRARGRRFADAFEKDGARLSLLVIDYVQLVNGRELVARSDNREREMAEVSKSLIGIAEELDVAILVLAQLNDDGQIRESRSIEHDAHNWWDIEREDAPKAQPQRWAPDDKGESVEIKIRKQRHGPSPASATVWFHPRYVLFTDEEHLHDRS